MRAQIGLFALAVGISFASAEAKGTKSEIKVEVTKDGFKPGSITVKPGTDVVLKVTRTTDETCATQIQVPSRKVSLELPKGKEVTVALGKLEKGEIEFGCAMKMMVGGKVIAR